MGWAHALCTAIGLLCALPCVAGDIYSFTDEAGLTRYTNVPTDTRYALLMKGPPEPTTVTDASVASPAVEWRQRAATYSALIDRAAARAAVHPALVRAVIAVESAFQPRALSRAGAQGLMQLLPSTARRYGVGNAFDPEQNVGGGARYLSYLLARYKNNLELALAAYNAGEAAVDRHGGHIPPYAETRQYVPAVMRRYREFLAGAI